MGEDPQNRTLLSALDEEQIGYAFFLLDHCGKKCIGSFSVHRVQWTGARTVPGDRSLIGYLAAIEGSCLLECHFCTFDQRFLFRQKIRFFSTLQVLARFHLFAVRGQENSIVRRQCRFLKLILAKFTHDV